ncbi:hypothetical protein HK102_004140 [Quaeritorhiza haematococci]|nr:hypothetical protein HK102_004140 [Quaeritorhiza haematococci]
MRLYIPLPSSSQDGAGNPPIIYDVALELFLPRSYVLDNFWAWVRVMGFVYLQSLQCVVQGLEWMVMMTSDGSCGRYGLTDVDDAQVVNGGTSGMQRRGSDLGIVFGSPQMQRRVSSDMFATPLEEQYWNSPSTESGEFPFTFAPGPSSSSKTLHIPRSVTDMLESDSLEWNADEEELGWTSTRMEPWARSSFSGSDGKSQQLSTCFCDDFQDGNVDGNMDMDGFGIPDSFSFVPDVESINTKVSGCFDDSL